jgi:hypothetical protein
MLQEAEVLLLVRFTQDLSKSGSKLPHSKARRALKTKKAAHSGGLLTSWRKSENYSSTTMTTRRFSARPFFVLFDDTGAASPYEIVDMRLSGIFWPRPR